MSEQQIPEFWGYEDDELLTAGDLNECIEDKLDAMHPEPWPETITLCGFVPKTVKAGPWAEDILERTLEWIDDNYGPPDDYTVVTTRMQQAAKEFEAAILSEYFVWRCEKVCEETVNCQEWVAEHCPHWLVSESDNA